ncbi:hypothetical protein KKI19_03790 [Patescibacteria group bacterium]|nr:hypothetical protein [Patescibacteria group bacterium]
MAAEKRSKGKITSKYLKSLCQKYIPLYESEKLGSDELIELIKKASQDARKNYKKLPEPRTCNLSTYVAYWIEETILKDFAKKTVKKIHLGNSYNTDDYFTKTLAAYFSTLPLKKLQKLRQKILTTFPYTKRRGVRRKHKAMFEKLEKSFVQLAVVRNKLAQKKGYRQYPKLILAKDQIPILVYQRFTKNLDIVINRIHKKLPKLSDLPQWFYSPLNLPCFICQLPFPSLRIPDEVIDIAKKEYPILKRFQHKVSIYLGDKTQIQYRKETDTFKIETPKNYNKRHQAIGLVHELGHTIAMLKDFKKGKTPLQIGKYEAEKLASEIELKLLKNLSPTAFRARLGDILLIFHRVLFELAVYANPKQDLPKLYAKIFNRCLPKADQQSNRLYLLDENIVLKPLSSLPQAIAYTELLLKKTPKEPPQKLNK